MSGVESRHENLSPFWSAQVRGAGRQIRRVWRRPGGAKGFLSGLSGEERMAFWLGLAGVAAAVGAFNAVNVASVLHDRPGFRLDSAIVCEASSWFSFVLFAFIPWLALRAAPLSARPRWHVAAIHIPALILFAVLHIFLFVMIRHVIFSAAGARYDFSLARDFTYEFRKDVLGYILALILFWIAAHRWHAQQAAMPPADATFDIRDGARLTRVRVSGILAVTSAGNYVEFVLEDGRRLLMRSPLSALEEELGLHGFVRVHRSWLVNAACVTGLAPEGSGDYRVMLGALGVPLSRRFPEALAKLRGG